MVYLRKIPDVTTVLLTALLIALFIAAGCSNSGGGGSSGGTDVDGDGYTAEADDCNDNNPYINPGAEDIPDDSIDQNCDGLLAYTYYRDADGDGYGNPDDTAVDTSLPAGYADNDDDCNDTDAAINPDANDIPDDGIDQDCSGSDTITPNYTYYRDADGDGYGDPNDSTTVTDTIAPQGYVTDNTDCDDTDATVYPGATEIDGDGIDQDCDGADRLITFEATFGGGSNDYGRSVQQTSDGGYILLGYTKSFGAGWNDMYLLKTDATGNESWYKTFGGGDIDNGYSVLQTSDGGYLLLGVTWSFSSVGTKMYLLKTDATGNESWYKTLGGSGLGYSICQTSDGSYMLLGGTSSFGAGDWDIYLVKTDAAGNELWYKTFGGNSYDLGYSIQQTSDGGYILLGDTSSFGDGSSDMYLVKTDASGNESWYKTFGGAAVDIGYSVQQTSDGGYILLGYTESFGAGYDMYLVKTDADGNELMYKTFGGSNNEFGRSIQPTSDGGYILLGETASSGAGWNDMYFVKIDAEWNQLWHRTFGGEGWDVGYNALPTSDGGYILLGETASSGAGGWDMYLIKTDADGNVH